MRTRSAVALAVVFAGAATLAAQSPRFGVGRPPAPDEVRGLGAAIAPDGGGLPEGSGTVAEGRTVYAARCASCHGPSGEGGGVGAALVGGAGTLATARPLKTVGSFWPHATTVWDYVNRAMPFDQPGLLKPAEVYAVVAYILNLNGIIADDAVMNASTLPAVRMPNRDGFVADPRPDVGPTRAKGTQESAYPIIVVPPGKGPFSFPPGYQTPWDKIQIMVTAKMSPNLFVLHGSEGLDPAHPDASGGRAMALFGPDGVLLVDTQNRQVQEKTLAALRSFTSAPIKIIVNTHIHPDHTGGNAFFAKQGGMIFAQENLREEMLHPPGRSADQPPPGLDMAGVPVSTYEYNAATPGQPALTFHMNGEIVDFIPMMPSHTAGDTIVRFRNANVIYIEDFYRNFGYPFADQANGGSIQGMIAAVDLFAKISGPDTWLVPGHGTLIKAKDLAAYRAMIVDIWGKVKKLRDQNKTLGDVLAANLTAPYDKTTLGDTQQSKDRFITEVYDEVRDFPPVVNGKRLMPVRTRP